MRAAYPLILLTNPTNEGLEALNSGEPNLSRESVDTLLEPTKRKGRGKALKTLRAEAEAEKRVGEDSHKAKTNNSSIDDDTPCRVARTHSGSAQCAIWGCLNFHFISQ